MMGLGRYRRLFLGWLVVLALHVAGRAPAQVQVQGVPLAEEPIACG